mmetsp:Transcript_65740/g.174245  ORF Transcript_65740/g.174245 Transcript_65740/m.174245 type:complete len:96 (+) Transcript_65740:1633-1920(+)
MARTWWQANATDLEELKWAAQLMAARSPTQLRIALRKAAHWARWLEVAVAPRVRPSSSKLDSETKSMSLTLVNACPHVDSPNQRALRKFRATVRI